MATPHSGSSCPRCGGPTEEPPPTAADRRATVGWAAGVALASAAAVWGLTGNWEMLLVYPTAFGLGVGSLVANDRALRRIAGGRHCPRCDDDVRRPPAGYGSPS